MGKKRKITMCILVKMISYLKNLNMEMKRKNNVLKNTTAIFKFLQKICRKIILNTFFYSSSKFYIYINADKLPDNVEVPNAKGNY